MTSPSREREDDFAFRFRGYLLIESAGDYTFYTSSDDGSQLFFDQALVVDNDGRHGNQERSGNVNLAAGYHEIVVTMFDGRRRSGTDRELGRGPIPAEARS